LLAQSGWQDSKISNAQVYRRVNSGEFGSRSSREEAADAAKRPRIAAIAKFSDVQSTPLPTEELFNFLDCSIMNVAEALVHDIENIGNPNGSTPFFQLGATVSSAGGAATPANLTASLTGRLYSAAVNAIGIIG
jgi:hypothetical protein